MNNTGNLNNSNRNTGRNTAGSRGNDGVRRTRQTTQPSSRSARPVQNTRNTQSVQRRRPSTQRRKKRNSDRLSWIIIFVICIMIVGAVIFLVNYLKDDGSSDAPETTDEVVSKEPEQSGGETTASETEETTAPETTAETEAPAASDVPQFTADLSAYEMYMNPTGADRDAYLVLVNPWNALTANNVPDDLVNVKSTRKDGRATQQLREYAAKALEALMLEAEACGVVKTNTPSGYPLSVMSAYRSYSYQNELFNRYVNQEMSSRGLSRSEAEAIVVTYSCRAGTSEHQTGLCVDMHTLSAANQAFRYESEATWLAENCHKFGFVLRFPENKTDITGITYEPWHFRYVGRYHATKMKDLNMCLEEYVEYLKNNG